MLLLDTNALIHFHFQTSRLGPLTLTAINRAWGSGELAVSAITFWEVSMLHSKQRLALMTDAQSWRKLLLDDGLAEIPVDGYIGILANSLADIHADPADRIIVATALAGGHQLVTNDRLILDWSGPISRLDSST